MPRTKTVKEENNEEKEEKKKETSFNLYGNEDKENFVSYDSRTITINFNKLLDRDLGEYNEVTYTIRRRAFYGFIDFISYNLNYILNKMNLLGIIYLDFHTKIYSIEFDYSFEEFFNDIKENLLNNEDLIDIINDIVEETYTISLDDESKNIKKNIIEDLQVTDSTNKSILKAAVMIRLLIPIISEFEEKNGDNGTYIYNKIFTRVIRDFSEPDTNSLVKLNKMVDSRVEGTEYSDKVIWSYLKKLGVDPYTVKCEIKNSIIFSIIAKLQINVSIVSFLDVVIKLKVMHKFTYNYPISYKTFKIEQEDDDLDENEKIDIMLKQSDDNEGKRIIHEIAIKRYIKNIIINKYGFSKEDVINLKNNIIRLNDFHKKILEIYYSNKFNLVVQDEYLYFLLLGMIYELRKSSYTFLPDILESRIDNKTKTTYSNKTLNKSIITSKEYRDLLENYKFTFDLIKKDDFILKLSSINCYKFIHKDKEGNEEVLKIDRTQLSLEIIRLAKQI